MATSSPSLDQTLKQLLDKQDQLIQRVAALEKPQGKDLWDKLGASTGLLVALVGGLFSFLYSYHQSKQDSITQAHQEKLQEIQTVGTFMPYLVGTDDAAKSIALEEVRSLLSTKVAFQIIDELDDAKKATGNTAPDLAVVRFLRNVQATGKTDEEKNLATKALIKVGVQPGTR